MIKEYLTFADALIDMQKKGFVVYDRHTFADKVLLEKGSEKIDIRREDGRVFVVGWAQ